MPGREDYAERREARIDRLENAAAREAAASSAEYRKSNDLVKGIPMGQPNIIGRPALPNLRERAGRAMDRAVEHSHKSDYYAGRAEAARNNTAISSDDPDAIEKLEEKIEKLETQQEYMKAANTYYRKHKTMVGFRDLDDEKARKMDARIMEMPERLRRPFAPFELSSGNAKIKAAKERIEKLRQVDDMPAETIPFDGGEIESDPDTNRIVIRFDERQSAEVTERLKLE